MSRPGLVSVVRALFMFDGWRRIMTGAEEKADVCRLQPCGDLAVNAVQNASTGIVKIVKLLRSRGAKLFSVRYLRERWFLATAGHVRLSPGAFCE